MDTWYDTAPTPDGDEPGGLLIPDEAWYAAMYMVEDSGRGGISPIITAAAPYIVAAELRRLADKHRDIAIRWEQTRRRRGSEADRQCDKEAATHRRVESVCRSRASELDGAR